MSGITTSFFLIFAGAAVVASLALYTRQPLIIAYIVLGALIGPYGLEWVTDLKLLADIADIGILFLLFLLGLDMQPRALVDTIQKSTVVALLSSLLFAATGFGIAYAFGFALIECLVIGAAMMFSSTIIGIKLLPTTVLHHKHTGELMIGLLLLQDLIAIFVLLLLMVLSVGEFSVVDFSLTLLSLPLLVAVAFGAVRWVVLPLLRRFDRFHEYIFLVALGWCLGLAEAGHALGLSAEIGAFLAGISLATSPISQYIAVNLKPLRDFFLILFFFSLGARFDLGLISEVLFPAWLLAAVMLCLKPVVFRYLLHNLSERNSLAWDLGFRLGQVASIIGREASHLIQATTIITFVVSSYIIILNYPTPIAISDKLRRD